MAKKKAGLTDKQQRFVLEYLVDLNATQAAIRAGYSQKTSAEAGYENLRKPQIADAIATAQAERASRLEIDADRVVQEYARIGFADIRKAVKWRSNVLAAAIDPDTGEAAGVHVNDVEFLNSEDLEDDIALAISEVSKDSKGGVKLKMHDKLGALNSIARHLGMFNDKVSTTLEASPELTSFLKQVSSQPRLGLPGGD